MSRRMSRKFAALAALSLLLLSALLGACAPNTVITTAPAPPSMTPYPRPTIVPTYLPTDTPLPPGSIALTDGRGQAVVLQGPAQRIVSLAPSNTELVFAVGAGAQMAGRDDYSDYPPEAMQVTSIGDTFAKLNTEAIVALKPDLVLVAGITSPEQIKTLEDLKLTVFLVPNPASFNELYDNIASVGHLTGHDPEATQLVGSLRGRVRDVESRLASLTTRPKVFYEIDATDPTKPYTTGAGTFIDLLIAQAGGENVGAGLKDAYAQISSEELVRQNPDIIVLGDSNFGVTPESVGQRPGWDQIAAVRNGAVYAFDDNLASRPGPRLVDGLEALAKLVHPEAFK